MTKLLRPGDLTECVDRWLMDCPSILEQTKWPTGYFRFPPTPKTEWFNCSIVHWQGLDWLVTRKREEKGGGPGVNSIEFWQMDKAKGLSLPRKIKFYVHFPGEHHEDPRAFEINGSVFLGYCHFRHGCYGHQACVILDRNFKTSQPWHVVYGRNMPRMIDNPGHEKNWIWFIHQGRIYCIYSLDPHVILEIKDARVVSEIKNETVYNWEYGQIRGGTPLTRVGNEYVAFFHSSVFLQDTRWKKRYYMGAYRMEVNPPFRITGITREPLLAGSKFDNRNTGAPLVVFPNGCILRDGKWTVVFGVNDTACGWIEIPHDELMDRIV